MNETTHSSSLPSQFDPSSLSPSEERVPLPPVHPSSTPPQSQELLSSPETPLPKTPQLPSGSRTSNNSIPKSTQINLLRTNQSGMVNDSASSRVDSQEDIGLGFGAVGGNGFGGRLGGAEGGKEGAGGHQSLIDPSAVLASSSSRAQPSTSASSSSHPQTHHRSSSQGNVLPSASGTASSSSSSSTFLPPPPPPPPSSSSSSSTTTHFKRPIASSSHSKPHPLSSTTFTIRPTPVPLASSADDVPMRSPSPSPQRPETSNSLVPSSAAGSDDEDAEGEDDVEDEEEEEDEPAGVPTEEEIEKLQEKVDQLSLEFGLGDDEEVGDDESREMKGLREMRDLIAPLLPALHMIPTLYSQVQSQSETIVSLRKVLTIQAELAQRAAEENRSIQEVERAGWESSLNVLLDKARDAHGKEMAIQQEKVAQAKPKAWSSGPSQSKKETGFAKIETVDNEDYDKLIKKWLELQAENRKAGVEKTTMMYKIRDSETQISALTEELHFLRASALHGSRSAPPPPLPSARNFRPPAPIYGSADDLPLPPPARRQTLGDARAEHLLLAAKRLRTLRVANPEIGLIKTADYGLAGMDVPEDVKNLGGVLAKSGGGGAASSSMMALGSSGFESSGVDGDGDDDMGSGTVGGRTPKAKAAARGKGKKSLAGSNSLHIISSSSAALPIPRTPTAAAKGKSPSKKKGGAASGATPSVEMTPGGTAIPGASFDDLLMAAGVFSRPTTTTTMGVSAARGSANADDGEDEIDEIESDGGSSTLIESPKRRRVEGGPASSWVPGQTLTSGDLSRQQQQQQQQPIAGPSSSSSASVAPPRNPLNSSTGSEGTMHATALDLLALASFGSQDPSSSSVHNPSSQASASSSSSSRLGGVMASSQPTNASSSQHGNGNGGGLVSLEPAFVLRSSPDLDPFTSQNSNNNAHPSSSFYPAQHTPLRPNQYQQDDLFSPSTTPGSSVPSRVKDFAGVEGGGVGGAGGEGLFGSPAGGGKFVNMSAANVPGGAAGVGAGANGGNNMPARRVRSPYLKWSNEEDELLARGVAKYGQKWDLVSKAVPTRSYHQCRQRWLRKLGVFDHKPAIAISTSNSATIFGGHADQES